MVCLRYVHNHATNSHHSSGKQHNNCAYQSLTTNTSPWHPNSQGITTAKACPGPPTVAAGGPNHNARYCGRPCRSGIDEHIDLSPSWYPSEPPSVLMISPLPGQSALAGPVVSYTTNTGTSCVPVRGLASKRVMPLPTMISRNFNWLAINRGQLKRAPSVKSVHDPRAKPSMNLRASGLPILSVKSLRPSTVISP